MTENRPDPHAPDANPDAARDRRNKLFGRLMVIGMLLLVLVYVGPMLLDMFR